VLQKRRCALRRLFYWSLGSGANAPNLLIGASGAARKTANALFLAWLLRRLFSLIC
jgi:hypothetical protein